MTQNPVARSTVAVDLTGGRQHRLPKTCSALPVVVFDSDQLFRESARRQRDRQAETVARITGEHGFFVFLRGLRSQHGAAVRGFWSKRVIESDLSTPI